jgi:hypothetical protein
VGGARGQSIQEVMSQHVCGSGRMKLMALSLDSNVRN